ncbi:hypothetical protein B0O80DRAFT_497697 [Mortierella sp. GBAus27b]|nr:hypothetical protein BGX31_009213 [Mortierella sp. GBA43]KAI8355301.1 hypothetical protein B0O80DRAFT_497697 [Mortierella sp. GBAus27b]
MKVFSASALFGVVSLAIVSLIPSGVQACERECQVNVSHAFADKYEVVSNEYFTLLTRKVEDSLFYGIPEGTLTTAESSQVTRMFKDAITGAQATWNKALFPTVFDTIFKDEPKFKGDCNNPKRVKQPPRGVEWEMMDCHKMDYICGNPPSICHFMPMIKKRINTKLRTQLFDRMEDTEIYTKTLAPVLSKVLQEFPKLNKHSPALHGNLNQNLASVQKLSVGFANAKTQWNKKWDLEIKLMLLTFP